MRVSPRARRAALAAERDRRSLEIIGIRAAVPISRRLKALALHVKRDGVPGHEFRLKVEGLLKPLADVMVDTMVAAHLQGRLRVTINAARAMADRRKAAGAYDDALAWQRNRLDLSEDQVDYLRRMYGNEAARVTRETAGVLEEKTQAAVSDILSEDLHVKGGVARMRETFDAAGVTPDNPFLLENLVRTQAALAYSAGRWNASQAPAVQEILWGYEYVTVGDDRVREEHAEMDGMRAEKDDPIWETWWPPAGFACVPAGTLVTTALGMKPIDQVVPGMMVLTHRGRWRPVVGKHRNPAPSELVAVHLDELGAAPLALTKNHRVLTHRGWIESSSLKVGDKVLYQAKISVGDESSRNVNQGTKSEDGNDRVVPLTVDTTSRPLLEELNADSKIRKVEVQPVDRGVLVEHEVDAKPRQHVGKRRLMAGHGCVGIQVGGGVATVTSDLGSNFRPKKRTPGAKRDRRLCRPLGVQPVVRGVNLGCVSKRNTVECQKAAGRLEQDSRGGVQVLERGLFLPVGVKKRLQATGPSVVDLGLDSQAVRGDAVGLFSHGGTIVVVRWATVKAISSVSFREQSVFNLSVAEDESYYAGGIATHNCRCSTLEIFVDDDPEARTTSIPDDAPEPDAGWAFNPGTVFADNLN